MTPGEVLKQSAEIFDERHKVYGDNYLKVGKIMQELFPSGVVLTSADDHNRFHILMLAVVKLTRYVQNWDAGGHEDSALDAAVYWAMLRSIDEEINTRAPF